MVLEINLKLILSDSFLIIFLQSNYHQIKSAYDLLLSQLQNRKPRNTDTVSCRGLC